MDVGGSTLILCGVGLGRARNPPHRLRPLPLVLLNPTLHMGYPGQAERGEGGRADRRHTPDSRRLASLLALFRGLHVLHLVGRHVRHRDGTGRVVLGPLHPSAHAYRAGPSGTFLGPFPNLPRHRGREEPHNDRGGDPAPDHCTNQLRRRTVLRDLGQQGPLW